MASVTGDVISVDESKIRGHVDEVVRTSVEETAWLFSVFEATKFLCEV